MCGKLSFFSFCGRLALYMLQCLERQDGVSLSPIFFPCSFLGTYYNAGAGGFCLSGQKGIMNTVTPFR